MLRRLRTTAATALLLPFLLVAPASAADRPTDPFPYREPGFAAQCEWLRLGEGQPPLSAWWRDPLCVEYDKRDITLDNGGALRFLAAEPARIAAAVPVCRYLQRDHWSVQTTSGAVPLVTWQGSYWFDRPRGEGGMHLTGFRVHGRTAGVGDAVAALRPAFPVLADALAVYGERAGETGLAVRMPATRLCLAGDRR
ncbi:hypothetical protein [Streptomyces sp. NPDC005805]|uniref:hypothetical protein n=1 Tax=Streptomyces sp. NPDC005805 TaxID=3157068 RepID=UPI0033D5214B